MKNLGYEGCVQRKCLSSDRCHSKLKSWMGPIFHECLVIAFLYSLTACGGGGEGGAPIGGGFDVGEVEPLQFNANGEAMVHFSELSGSEDFAFILMAANVNEGDFNIQLKSGAENADLEKWLEAPDPLLEEVDLGEDPTATFHEILREEESFLSQVYQEDDNAGAKLLAGSQNQNTGELSFARSSPVLGCNPGATTTLKVLDSLTSVSSYRSAPSTIRRCTDNAIYVVENEAANNLPDSILNPLIDEFEQKIPIQRSLLGDESDVDGNGRFVVCFCSSVNRLGQTAGGFITGYYYGGNTMPTDVISSSNDMDIFFVAVPDPNGVWGVPLSTSFYESNIGPTVLPHEYQHMINFNQKFFLGNGGSEESWANEGYSHLMEDLHPHTHLNHVSQENPSRVSIYLRATQTAAFTGGTALAERGGAYLFMRYLYEQADSGRFSGVTNGDDLLRKLIQSDFRGVENIEQVTSSDFKDLLLDFFATLQLSNTGVTENPRYNFRGINLKAQQNDNRGTILSGVFSEGLPQVPITASVNSSGGIFYNAKGHTMISSGNVLSFFAGQGMIPGGAVIRLR